MNQKQVLEARSRNFFKYFNRFMILLWRLGLGGWINLFPSWSGRIMVLVHTGRKSGQRRFAPVNYALVDGEVYCTAGFGSATDWYRNILSNPVVEIWLPDGWYSGMVSEVVDSARRLPLLRQVLIASGFVAPLIGLHPQTDPDEKIAEACAEYHLLHVRRTAARTGPGGPGALAWVWPLSTFLLLFAFFFRRRR